MKLLVLYLSVCLFSLSFAKIQDNKVQDKDDTDEYECNVSHKLKEEIRRYKPIANKIIGALVDGDYTGTTYDHLATFIDKFGPRFTGTPNLESAIDYMYAESKKNNLENVRFENVTVPRWVRGEESATLIEPKVANLRMYGLGYSVGTPAGGIQAEAIVVKDFEELYEKRKLVPGKIVVYDQKYINYGESVKYRSKGASEASKLGAVGALISSITPYSLNTPHTGMQSYYCDVKRIPVACITPQDAHMMRRMQNRGERLVISLKMGAQTLSPGVSRNTIVEIKGTEDPDKVVLVSGHIDSWDIGQGAMDDGGGAFISWNSLVVLRKLGLRPRRTLRAVLWTAEEMGLIGAESYVANHKHELENFIFVMESDEGTFFPTGLAVSGTDEAFCIVKEIMNLLKPINVSYTKKGAEGPDINYFMALGVPGGSLITKNEQYFVYHHSEADTMDVENPKALDLNTALWATVSYVIADLSHDIPRVLKYFD